MPDGILDGRTPEYWLSYYVGHREGRLEALQQATIRFGTHHHGPPTHRVEQAILRLTNLRRLDDLASSAFDGATWFELLALAE